MIGQAGSFIQSDVITAFLSVDVMVAVRAIGGMSFIMDRISASCPKHFRNVFLHKHKTNWLGLVWDIWLNNSIFYLSMTGLSKWFTGTYQKCRSQCTQSGTGAYHEAFFFQIVWCSTDFTTNIKICMKYVMSCLGCLRRLAGANFPLLYSGTCLYVQTAAASCTGEIWSCLDTDPVFQHHLFQRWYSKTLCNFDTE